MADRTVSIALVAKVQGFVAGVGTAAAATKQFGGELEGLGKKSKSKLGDIERFAAGAGVALLGVAGYAIKAAADFDEQMSHVASVADATAGEMEKLRAAALQAGKATAFSATEAATAEEELAKAGVSSTDILGGALTGALSLASAGSLDLAEAADIAAKAMNTFGLGGDDVGHIADVLAAAANKSATDVHELGYALSMGGLAAKNSGMTLEDTTGVLAAFADHALSGSDAGTSLKTMLQFLANPTHKAATLMDQLGISTYDTNGNFVGIEQVAGQLQDRLGGLTEQQRNQAFATIFGSDATRAATVLYGLGSKGVHDYIAAVNDQGAAQDTAAKKTDNLAGDLERLKGSIETVAISAGSGANGGLRLLVQAVDGLVGMVLAMPAPIVSAITVLTGVTGGALLTAAGFVKARQTVVDFMDALRDAGPMGVRVADGLGNIAGGLGKIGGVAARLGVAGAAIGVVWWGLDALSSWVEKKHAPVKADIDSLTSSIKEFASSGKAAGELASKYGESLGKIATDVSGLTKGLADLAQAQAEYISGADDATANWNPVDPQSVQRIKDLDSALSRLVSSGGATTAKLFLDQLRTSGKLTADQYQALIGMLPEYTRATAGAAAANTGAAKGFGDAAANASTMAGTLNDAVKAGQSLKAVFDQLNGGALDLSDAQIKAEGAVRTLSSALKDSGGSMDIVTEKGGKARQAANDLARAASDVADQQYHASGSLVDAKAAFDGYIDKLRKTLTQAGMSKDKIQELVATIGQMPPLKSTEIAIYDNASEKILSIQTHLNALQDREVTVTTYQDQATGEKRTSVHQGQRFSRWGSIHDDGVQHAASGLLSQANVWGPGSTLYGFREPETGGEAFIPKYGDLARSRSIAEQVVGKWLGGSVHWGAQQAAPAVNVSPTFTVKMVAKDAAGAALLQLVDVRIEQAQSQVARLATSGYRD